MSSDSIPLQAKIKLFVKVAVVFGLGYFLIQKGMISFQKTQQALMQWKYTLPALISLFSGMFLAGIRWGILLGQQGIPIRWTRVLQLQFMGNFFNMALPGAVSGDVVKAVYVSQEGHAEGKRAFALSSILFDRVAGVSALFLVSAGAIVLGYMGLTDLSELIASLKWIVLTAGGGILFFFAYLFIISDERDRLLGILEKFSGKNRVFESIYRVYSGIRVYHGQKLTVALTMILASFIHLCVVFACIQFSWALEQFQLHPLAVFIVTPLGLLVTAIPITPGGLGTGHAAFYALFHMIGSERGADIFSLFILFKIVEALIGGLIYLRFKNEKLPLTAPDQMSSEA